MGRILISAIRLYQVTLSSYVFNGSCRFYPSCSAYAIDAIAKYGFFRGVIRSVHRVLKCHPLHPGGYDPA